MAIPLSGNVLNKTGYTPVFNTPDTPEVLKGYLGILSREHVVLAHMMNEMPPSLCGSPGEGSEADYLDRKARVDALYKSVQAAYKYAKGDPADGKWDRLVQLLRMPSIKGRARWIGSVIEAKNAVSNHGWVNARSESEWSEWERRWEEEERLKQKVESWQQKVDLLPKDPVNGNSLDESDGATVNRTFSSNKDKMKPVGPASAAPDRRDVMVAESQISKPKANVAAPKASATLGFPVVKRPTLTTIGKPKQSRGMASDPGPSNAQSSPIAHKNVAEQPLEPREAPEVLSSPFDGPPQRCITDISEQSFLPPSFQDSQLQTSTPIKADWRRKPSPIPEVPASSPLSSPPNVRVYEHQRSAPISSSSLSQLPSTPTRNPTIKRLRPLSPSETPEHEHALKKARTMPSLSSSDDPLPPPPAPAIEKAPGVRQAFITPKRRGQLPTLTELLASARKAKSAKTASPKGQERRVSGARLAPPVNVDMGDVREQRRGGAQAEKNEPFQGKGKGRVDEGIIPFPAAGHPTWVNAKLNTNLYEAASPAKSLSSLAASDSGSDDDDLMNIDMNLTQGDGFDPPLASTQAQGNGLQKDRSLGWMGYNSQFDVDGKVDAVSKFMEKDVSVGGDIDFDYDGWMKSPSP